MWEEGRSLSWVSGSTRQMEPGVQGVIRKWYAQREEKKSKTKQRKKSMPSKPGPVGREFWREGCSWVCLVRQISQAFCLFLLLEAVKYWSWGPICCPPSPQLGKSYLAGEWAVYLRVCHRSLQGFVLFCFGNWTDEFLSVVMRTTDRWSQFWEEAQKLKLYFQHSSMMSRIISYPSRTCSMGGNIG